MNNRNFPFEDISLVLSRNCNLSCSYCPLEHSKNNMPLDYIKIVFDNVLLYKNKDFNITLFGGEPLLNKPAIFFIYDYLFKNGESIKKNNLTINLKLVTNGTLIDESYIKLFQNLNRLNYVNFLINLSIDGGKITQLSQRPFRSKSFDYYGKLCNNIIKIYNNDIKIEFGMVLAFYNDNILDDLVYLLKNFKGISIFIMPVDLNLSKINTIKNIHNDVKKYLLKLNQLICFINNNNLQKFILNLQNNEFRDLKLPPIGPAIDPSGNIYVTRDYLFTMDKNYSDFTPIGHINKDKFLDIIDSFKENNFKELEEKSLKTYYGRTFSFNKKIGDFFTNLIYKI